jgi:hypothetical protein
MVHRPQSEANAEKLKSGKQKADIESNAETLKG